MYNHEEQNINIDKEIFFFKGNYGYLIPVDLLIRQKAISLVEKEYKQNM